MYLCCDGKVPKRRQEIRFQMVRMVLQILVNEGADMEIHCPTSKWYRMGLSNSVGPKLVRPADMALFALEERLYNLLTMLKARKKEKDLMQAISLRHFDY